MPARIRHFAAWPWLWALVAATPALLYLLINLVLVRLLPGPVNVYLAQPLLWSAFALLAYVCWAYGFSSSPPRSPSLVWTAILFGVFQAALLALFGVLLGFGDSPYSHRPLALLGNTVFVLTNLAAIEFSRACTVRALGRRSPTLALALAALFFTALNIPTARISALSNPAALFRFSGETFLPTLSENLLASFLALTGGPLPAMAYRGILLAFEWFSPILPDLQWPVLAFLGTLAPILGLLLIQNQIVQKIRPQESTRPAQGTVWLLIALIAVTVLFINTGLLGVQPTLVRGASMLPSLQAGDIVITKDVQAETVSVDDIIRFQQGGIYIIHRVRTIQQVKGMTHFITRGDNNNTDDLPLPASRLEGKVIMVLPKIGLLSIGIQKLLAWAGCC